MHLYARWMLAMFGFSLALASCGRQNSSRGTEADGGTLDSVRSNPGSKDVFDEARPRLNGESGARTHLDELLSESKTHGEVWVKLLNEFRADPTAATAMLLSQAPMINAYRVLQAVAVGLASDDPEFVRRWLSGLKGEARAQVAMGLIQVWARYAPDEVALWISENPFAAADERCQQILVSIWAEVNMSEAARWSFGLPAGVARRSAMQSLGRVWGAQDSETAVTVVSQIDQQDERDDFSVSIAEGWALRDAKSAVAWFIAAPLSDESRRANSIYALFSDLAGQDPAAAEGQLSVMLSGPNRDAAIRGFIDTLEVENPKRVLPWVWKITDDDERREVIEGLSTSLAGRNPDLIEQLKSVPGAGN